MAEHRFLFIGGLHRSGTSILHRLLSEHPETSGFSNTGVAEDEGQLLQSVFPAAKMFGGPGRFAFDPRASLSAEPAGDVGEARDRLLREWGAYYDLTRPVLLEKSPPNLIRSDYFRRLFPGSRFVFIVRHPVCVALATRKWSGTSLFELLLHWIVAHRRMAADVADASDTVVLRYEDFVASPEPILGQIVEHARLSPFAPQVETVRNQNDRYLDEWSDKHADEAQLARIAAPDAAEFLQAFGYGLEPPFVSPPRGGLVRLLS
jgi:hypothetical protein